ncbi:MAG TPA: phosphonate C-P lyase system protein PhnH [Acetobacteraceae bacterium]|jgi:alpha-D-ribose 1-methylphosphonate 5-triphosphate synthase subunit PhnH|nr:phosphonate C-P lyase system protein PhnH [Acetobacteraceae bacterium]
MASLELPGFADPVGGAQACFRGLLDAMARPGTLHEVGELAAPPPLDPATASVLLTLVDADTTLWLDEPCAPAREWVLFHCGAPLVADPAGAAFALALAMPKLAALSAGSDAAPEDGASLILQVAALRSGLPYRISGPGLKEPALLQVQGLPEDFAAQWAANHALFPRGIDLVLTAGRLFCCLPRSVQIGMG